MSKKYSNKLLITVLIAILSLLGYSSILPDGVSKKKIEVGIEENLGQTLPLNLYFNNEDGQKVQLKSLITKPTILNFVYYECPGICSPLLTELTTVINKMDLIPGKDYQIITVSFNEYDNSVLAKKKKGNYLKLIEKEFPENAWRFLTGDSASIRQLTDAAGFMFKRQGDDFLHSGAIIAVSPEGKVTRYLYGIQFLPFDVKMALIEASAGRVGPTISKILLLCYSYDPEGKQYVVNTTRIFGTGIILFVVIFVGVLTLKPKRKK